MTGVDDAGFLLRAAKSLFRLLFLLGFLQKAYAHFPFSQNRPIVF